jgi:hypothetical protein
MYWLAEIKVSEKRLDQKNTITILQTFPSFLRAIICFTIIIIIIIVIVSSFTLSRR